MTDDIQWTEADGFPLAGTYVGPQAVLEGVFMRLGEIGDDYAVMPEHFVADDDTVVVLGTYQWKNKTSGDPAAVKMAHRFHLTVKRQDGRPYSRIEVPVNPDRVETGRPKGPANQAGN